MISPCYISCSAKQSNFERMSCCNRKLFYNRRRAAHRVDGYNWTCVLTQYLWEKWWWLQVLVYKQTVPLEIPDHCSWYHSNVWLQVPLWKKYALNRNIYQIHKYIAYMQLMVANVLLRNTLSISIDGWLAETTFVK